MTTALFLPIIAKAKATLRGAPRPAPVPTTGFIAVSRDGESFADGRRRFPKSIAAAESNRNAERPRRRDGQRDQGHDPG